MAVALLFIFFPLLAITACFIDYHPTTFFVTHLVRKAASISLEHSCSISISPFIYFLWRRRYLTFLYEVRGLVLVILPLLQNFRRTTAVFNN
jgi:hypothetical protein